MTTYNTASSDALLFDVDSLPPPAYTGIPTSVPFKLLLYSPVSGDHYVQLYAQGSNSRPPQIPPNKWSHLLPQWKFTDLSGNIVDNVKTTDTIVYDPSGNYVGVSGYAEFYYTDDSPTHGCSAILIWATAEVSGRPLSIDDGSICDNQPSYANSRLYAVVPQAVNSLAPTYMKVTRDGINPIHDVYWVNGHIPHFITIHGINPTNQWCPNVTFERDPILFYYPTSNAQSLSDGPVTRNITYLLSSEQEWTPDNLNSYLSALDAQNLPIGGFLKSDVVPLTTVGTTNITVTADITYDNSYSHTPFVWVSNPENNSLNRFYLPFICDSLLNDLTSFVETQKVFGYGDSSSIISTPYLTGIVGMSLSGFGGIYGLAVDPCYNLWATDAEMDRVYKFNTDGDILSTIELKLHPQLISADSSLLSSDVGLTPAGISLDQNGGFWVSFFDSVSVARFNSQTGNIDTLINLGEFVPAHDPYGAPYTDNGAKPTLAETDKNNNVWVSYTNTLCSTLIQYNSAGVRLNSITLPTCSNPMDILVDFDNNIWVTNTYHSGPPYKSGFVNKYDTSFNPPVLLSSISAVNPEYITMNSQGDIIFTSDVNTVNLITQAGVATDFQVGVGTLTPPWADPDILEFNILEGVACDSYGRLFIIDSRFNRMYVYDTVPTLSFVAIYTIFDRTFRTWWNTDGIITQGSGFPYAKSAQAFGDWTGWRFQIKYASTNVSTTSSTVITGVSEDFEVRLTNESIRRFNESFNPSETIQSYAIPPHIHDNPILWENFIGAMWGSNELDKESFGRTAYEKIANYVKNHDDVDVTNVAQLYSIAKELDVPIDDYDLNYPPTLRRLMDIFSINQQLLWGDRCKCNLNITNSYDTYVSAGQVFPIKRLCPRCGHVHAGNRGELFDATSYVATAWVPFIIKDNWQGGNYVLVTPTLSCSTATTCISTYYLSSYYQNVFPEIYQNGITSYEELITRFCFFDYIPIFCETQIAGVINWDDPFTTIDENISGINEWFGNSETVETMLNYTLQKGLGLIED